jgi:diaminopropionate ammonia-lyase family
MLFRNPNARRAPYPAELRSIMSIEEGRRSRQWLSQWRLLAPGSSPAWRLPGLAAKLELGGITLKDESLRSSLASFKVLGAPVALVRLIARRSADGELDAASLFAGKHRDALGDLVVISATDGNHGRALAAAAQSIGIRCVIVLHAHVNAEREDAIAALGARIVRIAGNYDDSVAEAARLADVNGWQVVSDTSYAGYEEIPRDVMQGYGILVDELLESAPDAAACPYTHVFIQGGVGGIAAAVASQIWERYGPRRPVLAVVEPEQADCLLQSAKRGAPSRTLGTVDSLMAGLACGEASPLAWRFLQPSIDWFMTVGDSAAANAMRVLAGGTDGDIPVVSGESGAAGLAGLTAAMASADWRMQMGLDGSSHVLLINTEGATAPGVYEAIVGKSARAVRALQQKSEAG